WISGRRDRLGSVSYSKVEALAIGERGRLAVSSGTCFRCRRGRRKNIFVTHLPAAKCGPTLVIPDAPDASSQMSTASRVVPERDGCRDCHADVSLQLLTRGKRLRRAK